MKGNTVNDQIKAFYQKHEAKIKIAALALTSAGLMLALLMNNEKLKKLSNNVKNADDLTDEEWEHLVDMARQMDEYVAERRALKSK
jgi:hypothetical protein